MCYDIVKVRSCGRLCSVLIFQVRCLPSACSVIFFGADPIGTCPAQKNCIQMNFIQLAGSLSKVMDHTAAHFLLHMMLSFDAPACNPGLCLVRSSFIPVH